MADSTLKSLTLALSVDNRKFKKGLTTSQKALKGFQKQVQAVGGMVAGAFAVSSLIAFGREALKLGAKMQGVRAAFDRLNDPNLLKNLQSATRGTVTQLDLMTAAVQAKNLNVPIQNLATYFKFATDRAIETGESVDYLVDSIVKGIGRKSVLILDNLGISSAELQDELRKGATYAEAVSTIINRDMADGGQVIGTMATESEAFVAAWKDFTTNVGESVLTFLGQMLNDFRAMGLAMRDPLRNMADFEEIDKQRRARAVTEGNPIPLVTSGGNPVKKLSAKGFGGGGAFSLPGIATAPGVSPIAEQIFLGWDKFTSETAPEVNHALSKMSSSMTKFINEGVVEMMAELDEEAIPTLQKASMEMLGFGKTTEKVGQQIGVMLVSQFDSLGNAIGQALSGAEDALGNLGKAILNNLGNILIMAGLNMGPAGLPLIVAGAAMQLGSGILGGLGNKVDSSSIPRGSTSAGVTFRIEGKDLVGAIDRNGYYNNLNT